VPALDRGQPAGHEQRDDEHADTDPHHEQSDARAQARHDEGEAGDRQWETDQCVPGVHPQLAEPAAAGERDGHGCAHLR
jgi:hypothetical protein